MWLKLFVSTRKTTVPTVDGWHITTQLVCVVREGGLRSFHDCTGLSWVRRVKILFQRGGRIHSLVPHPEVEKSIIRVLQHYHGKGDISFDCYAFANLISGLPPHKVGEMLKHWHIKRKTRAVRPGEVVLLLNRADSRFYHAAIALGWGLYLSVYGAGGDLEVSTLRDMRRDFGATDVVLARPK